MSYSLAVMTKTHTLFERSRTSLDLTNSFSNSFRVCSIWNLLTKGEERQTVTWQMHWGKSILQCFCNPSGSCCWSSG